jgi:hypothetical protein
LLVNRRVILASDLSIRESIVPKLFRQWLVQMAFLTPSLSGRNRFGDDYGEDVHRARLLLWLAHRPTSRTSLFSNAAKTRGKWNRTDRFVARINGIIRCAIMFSTVRTLTRSSRASSGFVMMIAGQPAGSSVGPFRKRASFLKIFGIGNFRDAKRIISGTDSRF